MFNGLIIFSLAKDPLTRNCFRAGEGRIQFLETYRDAFENIKSINGHIKQANGLLNGAIDGLIIARSEFKRKASSDISEHC